MAIQRWDPLRDMLQLQKQVNRLFEDALSRSSATEGAESGGATVWRPPTDLYEESGRYVLRTDLPGVQPSDLEIKIEEGKLVLAGERKVDAEVERESYLRVERPRGRFVLTVALPPSVDTKRIEANQQNGVLEVVLPKREEQGPSRIEVAPG